MKVRNLMLKIAQVQPCGLLSVVMLLTLSCFLASCAPKKRVAMPVYREEPKVQTQSVPPAESAPQPQPQVSPERKPEIVPEEVAPEVPPPPAYIPPPPGQAGTLLANANKAMQAGQMDKAEMHLERALRLAPRDAQLWHGMAKLRYEQGNYSQTVQFCLKSNSLAGKNGAIIRQNWLLMEKAYLKMGEKEKAAQARQKAGGN